MTKTQKNELKRRLFKILNIVSYVLSGFMILILIICIVKGCSNSGKKQNNSSNIISQPLNAININGNEYFKPYLEMELVNYDVQTALSNGEVVCSLIGHVYEGIAPTDVQYTLYEANINSTVYLINSDFNQSVEKLYADYLVTVWDNLYNYFLNGIVALLSDGSEVYLIQAQENSRTYFDYDDSTYLKVSGDTSLDLLSYPLSSFFVPTNTNDFVFNKEFNYNAPMNCAVNTPYYTRPSGLQPAGGSVLVYIEYDVGYFVSNGQVFNKIRWYWNATLGANYFDFNSNGNINKGPLGDEQGFYLKLSYYNSDTSTLVDVNNRNQVAFSPDGSSYAYYWQNASTWVNDDFRYITFLNDLSDSLNTKIKAFNNNNQYGGGIYNGGDNVFTLIGSAFTGLIPLLSIMILPNITLGMLLFIPLVVILVFAIIKIIKK